MWRVLCWYIKEICRGLSVSWVCCGRSLPLPAVASVSCRKVVQRREEAVALTLAMHYVGWRGKQTTLNSCPRALGDLAKPIKSSPPSKEKEAPRAKCFLFFFLLDHRSQFRLWEKIAISESNPWRLPQNKTHLIALFREKAVVGTDHTPASTLSVIPVHSSSFV